MEMSLTVLVQIFFHSFCCHSGNEYGSKTDTG
jgi:hypothetical protein